LLLAAKLTPGVIISWCLCAFTCASQQGPVFGSDRLPCSPPPPCNVAPCKKISQEVFKLPCRAGSSFRPQGFMTTHSPFLSEQFTLALLFSLLFGYSFIQTTSAICIISITLEVYRVLTMN